MAKVTVRVGSTFQKEGIEQAKTGVKSLGEQTKASTSQMLAGFAALSIGVAAVAKVLNTVKKAIQENVTLYAQQEKVEKRLAASALNNPLINGQAVKSLKDYASAMQEATGVGDEAIIQQEQFLVALGNSEEQIRNILDAALDLSGTGMFNLETAVKGLSQTLTGQAGTLGRYIPQLRELTAEQLKAGAAVDFVSENFAGVARAMKETTAGALMTFNSAWGDLRETLGGFVAGPVVAVVTWLTTVVQKLDEIIARRDIIQHGSTQAETPVLDTTAYRKALEDAATQAEADIATLQNRLNKSAEQAQMSAREAHATMESGTFSFVADAIDADQINEQIRKIEIKLQGFRAEIETLGDVVTTVRAPFDEWLGTTFGEIPLQKSIVAITAKMEALAKHVNSARARGNLILSEQRPGAYTDEEIRKLEVIVNFYEQQYEALLLQREELEKQLSLLEDIEKVISKGVGDFKFGQPPAPVPAPVPVGRSTGTFGGIGEDVAMGAVGGTEIGSIMLDVADPAMMLAGAFGALVAQVSSLGVILNPLTVIFTALGRTIAQVLNNALIPLIGILVVWGNMWGTILIPLLQTLTPIIKLLAEGFLWLYNNVIRHFANVVITTLNLFQNVVAGILNVMIEFANLFRAKGKKKPGIKFNKWNENWLEKISFEDLVSAGEQAIDPGQGGGFAGGPTTVQRVPDIYFTQHIDGIVIGEGGAEAIGEFTNDALTEFVKGGGQITFSVAG